MYRRKYNANAKGNTTFGLNLTSMTDMFTILLVFLLQTYSTSVEIVNPEAGLRLPSSVSQKDPVKGIKLVVSKTGVTVEGQEILKLANSDFDKKDIDKNDPQFILPLFEELSKRGKGMTEADKAFGKIFMQADRGLPYETLRKVMYTASMAGFPQLKMATLVGE